MTRRIRVRTLLVWVGLLMVQASAWAQTTGNLSGHVADSQGLAVPGAVVAVTSPSLQGTRVTNTSSRGDFLIPLLPPGPYTVNVTLTGFGPVVRQVAIAPGQTVPLDVALGVAGVAASIVVTSPTTDVAARTATTATTFSQSFINTLAGTRDHLGVLLMAPNVRATGPGGAISVSGNTTFENQTRVDDANVNDNIRGQAQTLYIEDAIQETTVVTNGASAEFGRFTGGLVNIVTKSGGNTFSGSLRETLNNDHWRALTPFEQTAMAADAPDARVDNVVPTYEYTFGGPILRDRLWFFHAGRIQTQESGRTLAVSNIPYVSTDQTRRYEAKGTLALAQAHRIQGTFTKIVRDQLNNPNSTAAMDLRSLTNQRRPEELLSLNYTGAVSRSVFLEGRYSRRDATAFGVGATTTDLIEGTMLLDGSRNLTRYWSDTGCGVCGPEQRDNREMSAKASYFVSTPRIGTHTVVTGYDLFDDQRFVNNHQSGSGYRIIGTAAIPVGTGTDVTFVPRFIGDGQSTLIQWSPIVQGSQGTHFRTHSVFVNDQWRVSNRLSASLGVRWDRNDGADQSHRVVAKDSAVSPRFGVVFDPRGDGRWSLTGSVGRYVAAISNPIADGASPAGRPQIYLFPYTGPDVNPAGATTLTSTPDAIRTVLDWYFANGGPLLPTAGSPSLPGVTPQLRDSLGSPDAWDYAGGVARQFDRASLRADVSYRTFGNFYSERTDTTTGTVLDGNGRALDLTLIENAPDVVERQYVGLTVQGAYRIGTTFDVGGNYTVSRVWGNFDGESLNSGPTRFNGFSYPEYKQASWNYPTGDLSMDQRHRGRLWVSYRPAKLANVTVTLLQLLETGVPYGAFAGNGVNPQPYVANPGYLTRPSSQQTSYYFGPRDEFRTEGQRRSDLAVQYVHPLPGARRAELFGQLQVINAFNQSQLCACGGTVFENGGGVTLSRIDQTVISPPTSAGRFQTFNPFTTTPVRGTNWDLGQNFGTALNRLAYTSPRQLRLTFGVRF